MVLANVLGAIALLIGIFSIVVEVGLETIGLGILLAVLAVFVEIGVYFRAIREDLQELFRLVRGKV
jgi:hypothetical protein